MQKEDKPIKAGTRLTVRNIITSLKLNHLKEEVLRELMFIEKRGGDFFSRLPREHTHKATSHEGFMQVYNKFLDGQERQDNALMAEAIDEYRQLALSSEQKSPAQRNP